MPSEVAFNSPPPVRPPADADCPPEKEPREPAPLPTPGKPAWCRVAFHTCRGVGGGRKRAGDGREAERTRPYIAQVQHGSLLHGSNDLWCSEGGDVSVTTIQVVSLCASMLDLLLCLSSLLNREYLHRQ